MRRLLTPFFALMLFACDSADGMDSGLVDGGVDSATDALIDSSLPDGTIDATLDGPPVDTGPMDAGPSSVMVTGVCGVLGDELTSMEAFSFANSLVVNMDGIELNQLTAGAQRILMEPNAGGSSRYSEAVAYEVLERCEQASLHATENEVTYMTPMPPAQTDMVVDFGTTRIGVGVARSFVFGELCMTSPPLVEMTVAAQLQDKLADIVDSTGAVSTADQWAKQILFVLVRSPQDAATVDAAWNGLTSLERGDTILYTVSTGGSDNQIYFEDRCPL